MARSFTHLTIEERLRIKVLRMEGCSLSSIAALIGRAKSTVSDELKRNSKPCTNGGAWYNVEYAHAKAKTRRKTKRKPYKMDNPVIAEKVKDGLRRYWSPQQIAGRLRHVDKLGKAGSVSHQCIYSWLRRDRRAGGDFHRYLRWDNKPFKRPRNPLRSSSGRIAEAVGIDERPASVEAKRYVGDWEGDTVEGKKGRSRLASLAERKTAYTVIAKVASKRSCDLNASLVNRISRSPHLPLRTVTVDNGLEFAGHRELSRALGCRIYFAHPYSSWERGLNENTNGLLRQFFPKGTDFDAVPEERIAQIERLLNTRPRKNLNYRTPEEVMQKLLRGRGVRIVF